MCLFGDIMLLQAETVEAWSMCSASYNVSYYVQLLVLLSPTPSEFHIVNQYKNNRTVLHVKFYHNIIL